MTEGPAGDVSAWLDRIRAVVEGGVNLIQLRDRALDTAAAERLTRALRERIESAALLFVNGLACDSADGIQLSERRVSNPRSAFPTDLLIGRSVHSVEAARTASLAGADLLIAGHIYSTPSHAGVPPSGPELLREITRVVPVPVIAIGGITASNAADCQRSGARGVAVLSLLRDASHPCNAARAVMAALSNSGDAP